MGQSAKQSRVYPQSLEYLVSLHFQEDYETLRQQAQELKTTGEDAPTRALGAFFYEHAGAFLHWITSYEYGAIRQREEDARTALRAKYQQDFPETDRAALILALEALSLLVTEGTYIENGMIASNPLPMYEHSRQLEEALDKALAELNRWQSPNQVVIKELTWRRAVNNGTNRYAELLIHFPYNKERFLAQVAQVEQHLGEILDEFLDDHFETCSDLRAHKAFLRHYRRYLEQTQDTPLLGNTRVSWLLNFQVDRMLTSWLCNQLTPSFVGTPETPEGDGVQQAHREGERFRALWHKSLVPIQEGSGQNEKLPSIEYIETEDSSDYLESAFGEHNMRACVITFAPVQTRLGLPGPMADSAPEQAPDEIQMVLKIYAYGICTVEFSVENLDLDIFQLRRVCGLISPFAPKASYIWTEGHDAAESEPTIQHEEVHLAPLVERIFHGLKVTMLTYLEETLGQLEASITRDRKLLAAATEETRKLKELRPQILDGNNWIYLPNLHWYTYANPRKMRLAQLVETASSEVPAFPSSPEDIPLTTRPDYIGLVLPLREKRASLHDWLAAEMPEKRNLAKITSHVGDLFFVSNHSAFLYFPDDPNFNVLQFIELVETSVRLHCLVASMMTRAKVEFDELAILEEKASKVMNKLGEQGIVERADLLDEIRTRQAASEHFDSDMRRSLDLLTLRVLSKYGDTLKLVEAMTNEIEIDDMRRLLDETMEHINRKRSNLLDTVARLQADHVEDQARHLANTTTAIIIVLGCVGLDAIITDFQAVFSFPPWLHLVLLLSIFLLLALFFLFYLWRSHVLRKSYRAR